MMLSSAITSRMHHQACGQTLDWEAKKIVIVQQKIVQQGVSLITHHNNDISLSFQTPPLNDPQYVGGHSIVQGLLLLGTRGSADHHIDSNCCLGDLTVVGQAVLL